MYPAVHEVVVVSDVTTVAVAEQVRAPAAAVVHRAWEVSEEVVAAAEAGVVVEAVAAVVLAAVVEAVAEAAVVAAAVVAEGGNES